ncbi:hypothetical protein BN440_2527 [Erwinia amylovora MR1]|nr:hypothetical protein BN440_2527 [Erwinia amylovora MR1]
MFMLLNKVYVVFILIKSLDDIKLTVIFIYKDEIS